MKLSSKWTPEREYLGRLTGVASRGRSSARSTFARPRAARPRGRPAIRERDPLRPFGHVPFGTYKFRETREIPPEHHAEYGSARARLRACSRGRRSTPRATDGSSC